MTKGVTVDFNANIARFSSAIDKATNDLNRFQSNANRMSGNITKIFGGLGVGLSVAGFASFIKNAIDAADKLNDLSKSTGLTVETLSGLDLVARQSGGDLESIAASINKLSVNIGQNEEKFRKLGITAKDPFEAFKQLSDIFVAIKDPQERAALGAEALGKSWAGAAPALAEGSKRLQEMRDKGAAMSGMTKEAAEKADAFNDKLEELNTVSGRVGIAIGLKLIPGLTAIIDMFEKATSKTNNFERAWARLNLTAMAAPTPGVGIKGAFALANRIVNGAPDEDSPQSQSGKITKPGANAPSPDLDKKVCEFNGGAWDGQKCVTKKGTGSTASDDPRKRLLENELKNLEVLIARENDLLQSRNRFIDAYNNANLLSIKQYYAAKEAAQNEATEKSIALLDREIGALRAAENKGTKVDKAEIQGKISVLLEKKDDVQRRAAEDAAINLLTQEKALREYADQINNVNAQVLEMSGNLKEAALITFDQQNQDIKERFTAEGNTEALRALELLRQYTATQAEGNAILEKTSIIETDLENKERRIDLSRRTGALSELGALQEIDAARTASVDKLKELVAQYDELAKASGNPKARQAADALRIKLEELEASAHQVADRFSKIFEDSAASAFEDFISGSKSAGEAFNDFANSVVSSIQKMIAQSLAQSLFKNLLGDGLGGIFGSIFGSVGGAAAGAGGGNASPGIVLPKFAEGTDYVPRDMVALIHKGEKITPAKYNNKNSGMNVVNHFHISSPVDTRTQQQIASQAQVGLMRASRRNN